MNKLIVLLVTLACNAAFAVPIVNENAGTGLVTIYADHLDPNRYYVAPNVVMINRHIDGVPVFSYTEVRESFFSVVGVMQMTLIPAYTRDDLEIAKAEILKKNPAAQFAGVPFSESHLLLTGKLKVFLDSNECSHRAGLIGQEQGCLMVLNSQGMFAFKSSLKRKTLFVTLQFEYSMDGMARQPDGSFKSTVKTHSITARVDGDQLRNYPQLIHILMP